MNSTPKFEYLGHDFGTWGCSYSTYTCRLCGAKYCMGGSLGPPTELEYCSKQKEQKKLDIALK